MLDLKKEFLETLNNCQWLKNCGKQNRMDLDFNVSFAKNIEEVIIGCNSLRWINICIDNSNNRNKYMSLNHRKLFNLGTNRLVWRNKEYLTPLLLESKVEEKILNMGLDDSAFRNVEYTVESLLLYNCYSDYYYDEFYEKMLGIFLSGHFPCGWVGTKKKGNFLIY